MTREVINELKKYTLGKKNTETVKINVLHLNRVIKALEQQPSDSNISDPCDGCRYELNSTNGNPCYSCGKYKLTEQQPCEDCISREETLNKINGLIAEYIPLMPTGWTLPLNIAKTINELPSVTPSIPDVENDFNLGYNCGYVDAMNDIAESEE